MRAMRRSSRQIARLYTTIDLASVVNLSALPPADELDGFTGWDEDDADLLALSSAEADPGRPAWPSREQEMRR